MAMLGVAPVSRFVFYPLGPTKAGGVRRVLANLDSVPATANVCAPSLAPSEVGFPAFATALPVPTI